MIQNFSISNNMACIKKCVEFEPYSPVNILAGVSTISARFTSSRSLIPSMIELLSATHKGSYVRNIMLPSLLRSKHTKTGLPIAMPRNIGCISLKNTDPDACKV